MRSGDHNPVSLLDSEYAYNAKAQKLTAKGYVLNDTRNEFKIRTDDEWIYDSNGNNTVYIFRELDDISGEWSMEKTELIYDLLALTKDYSLPYTFEFDCVNKPINLRNYNEFIDPDWNLFFSGTYYYSNNIISKINSLFQSKVTCLQQLRNFTFNWDSIDEFLTFDVYNLADQIVHSKRIIKNQTTTLEPTGPGGVQRRTLRQVPGSGS
jgi:hypothetical protein